MSLLSGEDTTSCGTQTSLCRTISYAKNLVSACSIIYLDGTDTSWQRTYACQPLTKEHFEKFMLPKTFRSLVLVHVLISRVHTETFGLLMEVEAKEEFKSTSKD